MPFDPPARVYVDSHSDSGTREEIQQHANLRVHLQVHYGQKQAQIELPVGAALFDREPAVEVYRRDLHELMEALEEALASPQGVL